MTDKNTPKVESTKLTVNQTNQTKKENTMNTPEQKVSVVASTTVDDKQKAMYERMINNKCNRRKTSNGDPNRPFQKMKNLLLAMVQVAEDRGDPMIPVPNIIHTALEEGWFNEVEPDQQYNRAYNYFMHHLKALPKHWKKEKHYVEGKEINHLVNKKIVT